MQAIRISSLTKHFDRKLALKNISLKVKSGEIVALIGPSGSGKSTLLRHLAGLQVSDKNIQTRIVVNDQVVQRNGKLSGSVRKIRSNIGVIFQQFNLINRLDVMTNVLIGGLGTIPHWRGTLGLFSNAEKAQALAALERVGLSEIASQRASTLSGGQQQRVAIARSLMQRATIILADEPIASLDPNSATIVMQSLHDLQRNDGKTVIVTLHQVEYARKYCDRVVGLVDGSIVFDGNVETLTDDVIDKLYGKPKFENVIEIKQGDATVDYLKTDLAASASN
ncbi:MAG: phosphonate transport system ATP-binding protein [Candidatus Azotimanducaceae bacterium]|jgi:phosphonate transport system ATP-binding protein